MTSHLSLIAPCLFLFLFSHSIFDMYLFLTISSYLSLCWTLQLCVSHFISLSSPPPYLSLLCAFSLDSSPVLCHNLLLLSLSVCVLPLLLTPSRLFALCPYPSHPILFLPLAIFQFHYFSFLLFSPTLSSTGSSFLLFSRYLFCSTLQPCIFLLCLLLNQFFNLFCLYITSLFPLLFFLLVPSFCLPVPHISSTFISPLFITFITLSSALFSSLFHFYP